MGVVCSVACTGFVSLGMLLFCGTGCVPCISNLCFNWSFSALADSICFFRSNTSLFSFGSFLLLAKCLLYANSNACPTLTVNSAALKYRKEGQIISGMVVSSDSKLHFCKNCSGTSLHTQALCNTSL